MSTESTTRAAGNRIQRVGILLGFLRAPWKVCCLADDHDGPPGSQHAADPGNGSGRGDGARMVCRWWSSSGIPPCGGGLEYSGPHRHSPLRAIIPALDCVQSAAGDIAFPSLTDCTITLQVYARLPSGHKSAATNALRGGSLRFDRVRPDENRKPTDSRSAIPGRHPG
jgi:hypothetical protein